MYKDDEASEEQYTPMKAPWPSANISAEMQKSENPC